MPSGSIYREALQRVSEEYLARNPLSMEMADRASVVLPGGTTRTTTFFAPFPPVLAAGEGSQIMDVDGNRRVDYLNNYTSLIVGHSHPDVLARAMEAASRGTAFSSPTEQEIRLAEVLVERVASVDQVRFTNSGTEATMAAMRLARAFTDRPTVARFEGSYHGTHDYTATPGAGIPDLIDRLMVTLPFNDIPGCEEVLGRVGDSLAGVIIEPVLGAGGVIAADQEFLDFVRQATRRTGALLIFDEIITFRLHSGGAQAIYGIRPDLTTFGKIIGGGFPIGGFGGREDVMALLHPTRGSIRWGGTFNGNPVSAAAGIATLEMLASPVIEELNRNGEHLVERVGKVLEACGVPARATGFGSLFNLHATGEEITDSHAVARSDPELTDLLHLGLMNRGYFLAPRGMGCLSTAMTPSERDGFLDALEDLLGAL